MAANNVVFQGLLGGDTETRVLPNGTRVNNFRLANSRKFRVGDEQREETVWMRVSAFGGVASGIEEYLTKGREVVVVGALKQNDYTDKNGIERSTVEINAREVHLAGGRNNGGQRNQASTDEYANYEDEGGFEEGNPWD